MEAQVMAIGLFIDCWSEEATNKKWEDLHGEAQRRRHNRRHRVEKYGLWWHPDVGSMSRGLDERAEPFPVDKMRKGILDRGEYEQT